jgi:hypothetical protein
MANQHDGGGSGKRQKLRSRAWFDNPDNPGMTALYLERIMNFGLTLEELRDSGKPVIGIAQTGSDISPCNRHHSIWLSAFATASAIPAESRWIRSPIQERASGRLPLTAIWPICRWSKYCTISPGRRR